MLLNIFLSVVHVLFACTIIYKYYITLDDGLKASLFFSILICLQILLFSTDAYFRLPESDKV